MLKLNSKLSKIIVVLVVMGMIISMVSVVFADDEGDDGGLVDPSTYTGTSTNDAFKGIINLIVGTVQAIGSGIAVIVLVVLGVKYMLGSAEEKSDYKSSMLPYLVGAVLIFAGVNIAGMIYDALNTL